VLIDIGLIENSNIYSTGGDGRITSLGRSVSRLPLNARFGKMLLVGAQADVLDYDIAMVAILFEVTPFLTMSEKINSLEKDND
jgi:HrpA-like RNA helicase